MFHFDITVVEYRNKNRTKQIVNFMVHLEKNKNAQSKYANKPSQCAQQLQKIDQQPIWTRPKIQTMLNIVFNKTYPKRTTLDKQLEKCWRSGRVIYGSFWLVSFLPLRSKHVFLRFDKFAPQIEKWQCHGFKMLWDHV